MGEIDDCYSCTLERSIIPSNYTVTEAPKTMKCVKCHEDMADDEIEQKAIGDDGTYECPHCPTKYPIVQLGKMKSTDAPIWAIDTSRPS